MSKFDPHTNRTIYIGPNSNDNADNEDLYRTLYSAQKLCRAPAPHSRLMK